MDFVEFDKIARLSRNCVVTEKIDGTNASIVITDEGEFLIGSRTRWIVPGDDNFGFARWATDHKEELLKLGPGAHYGEWWGLGIQRGYGLKEKRFSLFNSARWADEAARPPCCGLVPVLYSGVFDTTVINDLVEDLRLNGSKASPGFLKPEGVIVWHEAARIYLKKTVEKDEAPKSFAKG